MSNNKLLIIDKNLKDIDVILSSLLPNIYYLIIEDTDTYSILLKKISDLNLNSIEEIGLIKMGDYSTYYFMLNTSSPSIINNVEYIDPKLDTWIEIISFLKTLKKLYKLKIFNFISCYLNKHSEYQYVFSQLESKLDIKIGASSNKIGKNLWILDRNNIDIKTNFFTDNIYNYDHLHQHCSNHRLLGFLSLL
jgi:hypothetical protein